MEETLYEKTISETTKMLLSSVAMFAIQFLSTAILARIYSPTEFGLLSKITIITSFADVFCQLGLGQAIIQKGNCSDEDYDTVLFTSIVLGILTTSIVFIFARNISELVKIDNPLYLRIVSPSFIITSISILPLAKAQREMRFGVIAKKDITSYLIYLTVSVLLGKLRFGITGLIIGMLSKYLCATIIALFNNKKRSKFKFYSKSFKNMLSFGFGYSLCKVCSVATDQSDYYAIAKTLNNNLLGIYNKAFQLISTPISLIGQGIDQVFFSSFSKIQSNEKRIGELYISASAVTSLISFFATVIIFHFSGIITLILLGKEWIESTTPISILSLAIFFRSSIKISDPIMRAKGFVYQRALFHCFNTLATILLATIGSRYGLIGVSAGVVLSQFINYILNAAYVTLKLSINLKKYIAATLPCIVFTSAICLISLRNPIMTEIWKGIVNIKIISYISLLTLLSLTLIFIVYKLFLDDSVRTEVERFAGSFFKVLSKIWK